MRPRFAGVGKDNVGLFHAKLGRYILDQPHFVSRGTIKAATQGDESFHNDGIGVAFDSIKGFHPRKVLTPLIELRHHQANVHNIKRFFHPVIHSWFQHGFSAGKGSHLKLDGCFLPKIIPSGSPKSLSERGPTQKDGVVSNNVSENAIVVLTIFTVLQHGGSYRGIMIFAHQGTIDAGEQTLVVETQIDFVCSKSGHKKMFLEIKETLRRITKPVLSKNLAD
mmetsp:Transcript_8107/g.14626  ORF Transcript_8107/g.14626 Transcript_8107/m.14626 type:complete len:222 (+) Transcript_8107:791-1456(+)